MEAVPSKKKKKKKKAQQKDGFQVVHLINQSIQTEGLGTVDYHGVFACLKDMQMQGVKQSGFDVALKNILERDSPKPQWAK